MDTLGLRPSDEEQRAITMQREREIERQDPLPFKDFTHNWRQVYSWRRLFRTSKGYLGTGAQDLRPGDSIYVLPGANIPFALRELENGHFALVGEAYVHGIMHGELVGSEGWKLEDIVLE